MSRRRTGMAIPLLTLVTLGWIAVGAVAFWNAGFFGLDWGEDRVVSRVDPSTPAARAGLAPGDRIVERPESDAPKRVGRREVWIVERDGVAREVSLTADRLRAPLFGWHVATFGLALAFLAVGTGIWLVRPGPASRLVALYGICEAVHWGAFVPAYAGRARIAVWVTLLLGTVLGSAVILHLALAFPRRRPILDRSGPLVALYVPAGIATLLGVAAVFGAPTLGAFGILVNVTAYAFTLLALLVVAREWKQQTPDARRRTGSGLVVAGFLAGTLPYLGATAIEAAAPGVRLPGGYGTYPLVLFFVLIPLGFSAAILRAGRPTWPKGSET